MPLDAREIRKALLAKGMVQDPNHHEMFRKDVDGVATLVTRLSWAGKKHQVPDHLASSMAAQACLQLAEFKRLVSCELTEGRWDALVRERCADGNNPFTRR